VKRRINIWKNLDWTTVIVYVVLVLLGWLNIYAAVYNDEHQSIFDFTQRYGKQMMWIVAAFFLALCVTAIDSNFYPTFAYIIYACSILLLAAVLFFGKEVNGARAWFEVGPVSLQPAEFMKLACSLTLARFMSSPNFKINTTQNLLVISAILAVPAALILLQPDMGSVLVFSAFLFVLYREGLPGLVLFFVFLVAILFVLALLYAQATLLIIIASGAVIGISVANQRVGYFIIGVLSIVFVSFMAWSTGRLLNFSIPFYTQLSVGIIIPSVVFLVYSFFRRIQYLTAIILMVFGSIVFTYTVDYFFHKMLADHQQKRVNILLGKESDPLGAEYNVNQSKIAIGSGGFAGKGFLQGTQTKFNFVPEQSTDFIFCTVGEEWGFLGSITVLGLFGLLLIRLIRIAERQRSVFNRIYGYSVTSVLFLHVAINVGMTIGLLPVIGIPLPFFSYGGSSLWSFTVLLFIFLRLDSARLEKSR